MEPIRRFWRQPSTHYRNFQIAFALLFLNFVIPTGVYLFAPAWALEQFAALNTWLGGAEWAFPEARSRLWRYLGTANVAALAFMCWWLLRDLRNRRSVLGPLVFLKGAAGTLWLAGYLQSPASPAMLAAALFDAVTCAAVLVFGLLAWADIQGRSDGVLVPEPVGASPLGWAHFEHRWMETILEATLPALPEEERPGIEAVDLEVFWPEYLREVPLHFRLGLRLSTWMITFWPILTFRAVRTFHGLSADGRDEVLQSIEHSRLFVIRQMTFVFKTTAGFAYFSDVEARQVFPSAYGDGDG